MSTSRICIVLAMLAACVARGDDGSAKVASPDGQIEFTLLTGDGAAGSAFGGQLAYRVTFGGKPLFERSLLALQIQNQPTLGDAVKILSAKTGGANETYTVVHGKANPIHNEYRSVAVELVETAGMHRRLNLEARAFNDGVAFRYLVPEQTALREVRLASEQTEFRYAKEATAYPLYLNGFRTSFEDNYHVLPLSAIHPGELIGLPFLAEVPGVAWVAVTEAYIDNYAGMYLKHTQSRSGPTTLVSQLAPRVDVPELAVTGATPFRSPWRVLMIGAEPGRLIESNIVLNLNPPSAITDTTWIKPGKTSWDWWSGSYAEGVSFKPGMNTETMKHYIDFSAKSGFEYMLIDAGWSARATGPNDSGGDITKTSETIDMPAILAHARAKDVKVWVWAHWTNIDRQMDEAFPLYEKWGLAGVKIDFMDRDDQWMTDFFRRVLKKAAEHHLMIDFHGAYKPDGIERTWPNLMTREGVLGLEYTKWSGRVNPDHNVMLPFTRMLAGPMDYTPGGFNNVTREEFVPRGRQPMVMGTRAHQLALFVVFESGFQMVSDFPEAYDGQKEFTFLKEVPATWDETRVLNGRPGDYVTIARRRGRDWFLGAISGWRGNDLEIPLTFLGAGAFTATVYADAPDAAVHPKNTTIEEKRVDASTRLLLRLAPGGGQAIHIRPRS